MNFSHLLRFASEGLLLIGIIALLALFGSATISLYAQTLALDSLQRLLKTTTDNTAKVRLLNRIAEEQINEPQAARLTAEQAYTLASQNNDPIGAAEALNRLAAAYNEMSLYDDARRTAQQARELAQTSNDAQALARSYTQLGTVDFRQGNYNAALDYFFQALPEMEKIHDDKEMVALLNRIGNVYTEIADYQRAVRYYNSALQAAERSGDIARQASLLNNLGTNYKRKQIFDTAAIYYQRSYRLNQQLDNKRGTALNVLNIGESQLRLGLLEEAQTTLQKALHLWEALRGTDFIAYTLCILSEAAIAQKNYMKAMSYGECALHIADSAALRPSKRSALKVLSDACAAAGQTERAFALYKNYIALRDSLVNDENTRKATLRESKYAADKKDTEIKLLKKDAENQMLVRNSLVGGLGLVGVLVFVLVFSNNRRKKANALLQQQSVQIQIANTELQQKNIAITEAHTETQRLLTNVNDSIRYAKRIQDAMLPSTETLNRLLPEHFIFFRPKDVVSGDFYWCKEVGGKVFVAAVDCTGHGVPGAFMSLIGNSLLNDITQRLAEPHPDLILNELHHDLQRLLRQRETNNDDGMDICLCMIDLDTRIVEFAGAMNPLYAVVAGELREFKGTPEELGGREERSPVYERHVLDLSSVPQGATMLYLTTDGYKDQFDEMQRRFMPKRLRPLLHEIAAKALVEQPRIVGEAIDAHRGAMFQVDDMLVLGVRL
ncbi:MAG: tetratricopeptide repeat protein [Candidatus Kapabacteria bacterium]|nr:tetratricopeptide repeat protein [Candidatus Kapabacteria bacterium]